jgi:hypothetical protein
MWFGIHEIIILSAGMGVGFLVGLLTGFISSKKNCESELQIKYDFYENRQDKLIKKTLEIGYQQQIIFKGMPIGEPAIRILKKEVKYDADTILKIKTEILNDLSRISVQTISQGIKSILPGL